MQPARPVLRRPLAFATFPGLAVLLSCGGGEPGQPTRPQEPGEPEPDVAAVEVTPDSAQLTAFEETQDFDATVTDQSGDPIPGVEVSWSVDPDSVASLDESGTATARANGSATIEAEARGAAGSARLAVDQAVASVAVAPGSVSVNAVGDTAHLSAEPRDANGHRVVGADLSWRATDTSVVAVDSVGVATAAGQGTAHVVAQSSDVADSAFFSVDQDLASVEVTPDSARLTQLGESRDFDATARDENGHPVPGTSFRWSSSDPSVAAVNDSGLATARAEGEATISAAADGVEGTAGLSVVLPSSGRLARSFQTTTEVAIKSSIAVSEDRLVLSSGRYLLYSKDGERLAVRHVGGFFSDFEDAGGADARAIYDPASERFFLTSMDHGVGGHQSTDTPGRYFLAVSTSSSPSGFGPDDWHKYAFETRSGPDEPAIFPDIPRLSVTENAVVLVGQVTAIDPDRRPESGCFTQLVTLDKSTILAGETAEPMFVDEIRNGERSCAWLQPVKSVPASSSLPMITEIPGCRLQVWTLRSPLTDPTLERVTVPGTGRGDPYFCDGLPQAPQPDTDWRLRTGRRSQPMMQPAFRDGSLWVATTIGVRTESGDVTGVRWAEIGGVAGGAPQVLRSGTFRTEHYGFYPAISPNATGDFVVAYGRSSESLHPGAYYRFAEAGFPDDSISGPQVLKQGEASLTSGQVLDGAIRFAEFFDVAPDPVDDGLWMVGQYVVSSDTYDLWVGKVAF